MKNNIHIMDRYTEIAVVPLGVKRITQILSFGNGPSSRHRMFRETFANSEFIFRGTHRDNNAPTPSVKTQSPRDPSPGLS